MNKRSKRKDWSRCECLLLLKINMIKRMKQSNILCQVQCQRWGSWGEMYCLQKDSKWWQVLYHCWHISTLWRIVYDATPVEGGEEVEALTSVAAERWSLFDLNLSSYSLFLPLLHCIIVYQELSNTCFLLTAMPLMKYQTSAQLVAGVLKPNLLSRFDPCNIFKVKPTKQNYCSKYEELVDGVKCP